MTGNNRGFVPQERDRRLLRELATMRVVDREQAKCAAGFTSTTRVNARLLTLSRVGLLRRFFLGTVGARKALYALSPKGAAFANVPYRGPRRPSNTTLAADFFITHQLAINDVHCLLQYRPAPIEDARVVRWLSFFEPLHPGASLIPDGYAEIVTPRRTVPMFLEVDLGHESRSVWRKKVRAYVDYALSGNFTKRFAQAQFRTIVVGNSERRLASLRAATAEVTQKIFWFATLDAVTRDGIWSPIWERPVGEERISLL